MSVGPHLLDRIPSPPDARDWQLEAFLDADPLTAALIALQKSHAAKATKAWAAIATQRLLALNPPGPPAPIPVPPSATDVVWNDVRAILNQAQTGHCVGFGWAQWGNTDPVEDSFVDSDGHAVYYECKVIDGEPGQENGSNVRSGAKAMQGRGRLNAYAFASSVESARQWVVKKGPVVLGTDWYDGMFDPDPDGTVHKTGSVAGGHCYVWVGDRPERNAAECINSWDSTWGVGGHFFIPYPDLEELFAAQGEACAAVELPLAA